MGKPAGSDSNKSVLEFPNNPNTANSKPIIPDSYRQVMDMQRELICCFQSDLKLSYANPAFCDFYGNKPELIQQSSFCEYIPCNPMETPEKEFDRLLNEETEISFRTAAKNRRGEQRFLWWVCHFIFPGIIQASARDITNLISNTEEKIENLDSIQKINAVLDSHNSPILSRLNDKILDVRTIMYNLPFLVWALDDNLDIVFWNLECEKLTGYLKSEVITNEPIFNQLFPQKAIRDKYIQDLKSTRPMIEWNSSITCKDKSSKWISCFNINNLINIDEWKYIFIGIDRTDKKNTELALKESEGRYRSLFSSIQAGLIVCREIENSSNGKDYILIDHNAMIEKMLARTKLDLQNKSVYELFPDIAESWANTCKQIKSTSLQERFEYYYHPRQQIFEITIFSPAPGEFAAFFIDITDVISTREELCNQLDFMQTLIDFIPNPIFFKDKKGRFFNCNKAFEMYVGRGKEEILNQTISILESYLELRDIEEIRALEQQLMESPHHIFHEYSIKHADGNTRDVIINRAAFCDKAGKFAGIVGVLTDISEKRNIERKLETQLHFQQFLVDIIPAPIFFLNESGRYFQCNKAFEDYTGKGREEIIGQSAAELPECVDMWDYYLAGHIDEDALTKTSSGRYYTKFYHVDGSIRDVIISRAIYRTTSGEPAGLAGVILDVTAQRSAERKLTEQVMFLETLIETIPNPVYYRNLDGILLECNRAYAELVGTAKEDLVGSRHFEVFSQQQAEEFLDSDIKLLDSGMNRLSYTCEVELANGQKVDLLINKTILYDNEGNMSGVLGALTDLTEHREMQRTMARLDQYRIIGEMAAAIGHEVRNPMTTVRGFLQLLNENDEYTRSKEYFDLMIEEIDRANSIITDFLSLGKDLHTELKLENLNQIIENSFLILSTEAKKFDHEMKMDLEAVPLVPLDFKQIRQLIFNLVRNGLEAMTNPGVLTLNTFHTDNNVVLAIQDQGIGISSEVMQKLGKPFVTTKEKGTGLGLAVCYSIVERHGAQLEVNTSKNGTTFCIYFPIP